MAAIQHVGAAAPGLAAPMRPTKDEAPAGCAAQGFGDQCRTDSSDCRGAAHAGQALQVIEGERKAADFLARLHAQQADPDELALIVSMMYGSVLRGFCRVIAKALGVHHV